jgi:uncharacterized protein YggE
VLRTEYRTISVSGSAEVRVTPDEVVLTLGIETNDMNLTVAKEENDRRVKKVLAVARTAGVEDKYLQTDFLDIEPRYDRVNNKQTFLGYWVQKTLSITLRDLGKFDGLLSDAITAGANYVHGIEFRTTQLRKYRDQARAQAIRAAREKAVALTQELGVKLGAAQNISEQPTHWWSSYSRYDRWRGGRGSFAVQNVMQSAGEGAAVEGTLAPGQILVTAQVSVAFAIE